MKIFSTLFDDLKKVLGYILDLRTSRLLLSMKNNGYLKEIGWFHTQFHHEPVDENMNPIPWKTYAFIAFIKTYLKKDMKIFEYGSGNSTLFYAPRVSKVYTVEYEKEWYERIRKSIPENVQLYYVPIDQQSSDYIHSVSKPGEANFDMIIIDGRMRNDCIKAAFSYLYEDSILVLDDSEREEYREGIDFLIQKGMKKIDFWGIAPSYFHNKNTSVFFWKL